MRKFLLDFTPPTKAINRMSNPQEIQAWDKACKRKYGFFAGLSFFSKINTPLAISIVSRHWPHRLCWSWYLHAGLGGKPHFKISRKYRFFHVGCGIFYAQISWQDYWWMETTTTVHRKLTRPEIYWIRHLENMDMEGSA